MQLKEWLEKNNITATDFSKEIGYHRNYIYKMMRGKYIPGKKLARAIEKRTENLVSPLDLGVKNKICPTCGGSGKCH